MSDLMIGDPKSIELRDKGRAEAWLKEYETRLRDKVFREHCPSECEQCQEKGPDIDVIFHKGIVWKCSRHHCDCDSCGQPMEIDIPNTDFEGVSIGWTPFDQRKPFDPAEVST